MRVVIYVDDQQLSPFEFWLTSLQDKVIKERIFTRLDRIAEGNFGDHKFISDGVWELRMNFDIKKAVVFWKAYVETMK